VNVVDIMSRMNTSTIHHFQVAADFHIPFYTRYSVWCIATIDDKLMDVVYKAIEAERIIS